MADPWEIVKVKWKCTFGLRREEIIKKNMELAHEIFIDWTLFTQGKSIVSLF